MSTPRGEGAVIWKHFKPQNTRATHGETALRTSNPCPLVRNQGQKIPNPGLKCEQTWGCSGEPAGRGSPSSSPLIRLPQSSLPGGQSWVSLSPREAAAAPRRLCTALAAHTGLFVLFIKQEQIAPGSFNPRLGFHRHLLLSQHNSEAAAGLGGARSDTKSRAQGLLPDSFSL